MNAPSNLKLMEGNQLGHKSQAKDKKISSFKKKVTKSIYKEWIKLNSRRKSS
jgi:hypothetical protein